MIQRLAEYHSESAFSQARITRKAKMIDFRYFGRTEPTVPMMGCACSNPPFELCRAGNACQMGENACTHNGKMEPIEDEI